MDFCKNLHSLKFNFFSYRFACLNVSAGKLGHVQHLQDVQAKLELTHYQMERDRCKRLLLADGMIRLPGVIQDVGREMREQGS